VADLFVERGTLVTTVGYAGKHREEKRATGMSLEPNLPMAVLVNSISASASEIVAGALKNLDRAVIIGAPTFGKGSVQVLYDNDDESKLKLTIAQYLTPGDVSIQSVGIQPDIHTLPMRIPKELRTFCDALWLFGTSRAMREADLDKHLQGRGTQAAEKPLETVRYYDPPKERKGKALRECEEEDDEAGEDDEGAEEPPLEEDTFVEDFEIRLARDLVVQSSSNRRREMLARAASFLERRRAEEQGKVTQALRRLGIDWTSMPPPGSKPVLQAVLATERPGNRVKAGEVLRLRGTVRNVGSVPASQVYGKLESDDMLFKDREMAFGLIRPGESKSFDLLIRIPKDAHTRVDPVRLVLTGEHELAATPAEAMIAIEGLPRPVFAYGYQVVDTEGGNGNGLVEPGEKIRLLVTVENRGKGRAYKTQASLKNDSGEGILIGKGRFDLGALGPGESRKVEFTFEVRPNFREPQVQISLGVYDRVMRESVLDKLKFPVVQERTAVEPVAGLMRVANDNVEVRGGAAPKAPLIGWLRQGAVLRQTGRLGEFARVELEPARPGFVRLSSLQPVSNENVAHRFVPLLQVTPPQIVLEPGPLTTTESKYRLRGEASDDEQVADMYVFVANRGAKVEYRKVAYRSNRNGPDPKRMRFDVDVPLMPGVNQVTVFVRQNDEVQARETLILTRPTGTRGK